MSGAGGASPLPRDREETGLLPGVSEPGALPALSAADCTHQDIAAQPVASSKSTDFDVAMRKYGVAVGQTRSF